MRRDIIAETTILRFGEQLQLVILATIVQGFIQDFLLQGRKFEVQFVFQTILLLIEIAERKVIHMISFIFQISRVGDFDWVWEIPGRPLISMKPCCLLDTS